jgi:hypothetical protein
MSLAIGAADVQFGPRALGTAADLNKAKGLSMCKTSVLRDWFGLQRSSAASALRVKKHSQNPP